MQPLHPPLMPLLLLPPPLMQRPRHRLRSRNSRIADLTGPVGLT
jgi:hypothetical protein